MPIPGGLLEAVLSEGARAYVNSRMSSNHTQTASQSNYMTTSNTLNDLSSMMPRKPVAPASSTKTVRRHKKGNSKGVDPHDVTKYPSVTVSMPKTSLQLKSPFAQFKKWFDGSTTLKNSFSFTMGSKKGKRGVLLIPLRTDAAIYGSFSSTATSEALADNYNHFCTGTPGGSLLQAKCPDNIVEENEHWGHVVGDLMRTGKDGSTVCEPHISIDPGSVGDWAGGASTPLTPITNVTSGNYCTAENMLVPGMQLLHVEAASWSLNSMKVVKQRVLDSASTNVNAVGGTSQRLSLNAQQPLVVHGNFNALPFVIDGAPGSGYAKHQPLPARVDSHVSRRYNGARQQNMLVPTRLYRTSGSSTDPAEFAEAPFEEQYEIQAGYGSIEYTIFNEGPTQATVELVLFKPNKHAFPTNTSPANMQHSGCLAENVWSWLKTCNGEVFKQSVFKNRDKALQTNSSTNATFRATDDPKNQDIINNPYVNFLPESSFKSVTNNKGVLRHNIQVGSGGGDNDPRVSPYDTNIGQTQNAESQSIFNPEGGEDASGTIGDDGAGRVTCPYTHVGRGYAVVPPQSKRTIRIPLPKMRYNPSRDQEYSKLPDDYKVACKYKDSNGDNVEMLPTVMNPQSIMCAMSVNGALQDYFEDTTTKAGVFRGQDFTPSFIYVDAVYREKVYPAAMQDCQDGVSFMFGNPMGTNLGSGSYYPGQVIDQRRVIPVNTGTAQRVTTTTFRDSSGNEVPMNYNSARTATAVTEERQSGVKRTVATANDEL